MNRESEARDALLTSITTDPLNWESYKLLGDLGQPIKVSQYLNIDKFKSERSAKAKTVIW